MDYIANHIELTGCLASAPQFSHDNHGRHFFSFYLEVERLSGTVDRLPVAGTAPAVRIRGGGGSAPRHGTNPFL